MLDDLPLLGAVNKAVVNTERHRIPVRKVRQNRLFLRSRRPFPNCPHAFVTVTANKMIRKKPHCAWHNTVEKFLNPNLLSLLGRKDFLFSLKHFQ